MANLSCAVIVVNYNGGALVIECLESLFAADDAGLKVQIVVVDNDSTDGSIEAIARLYPSVTVINSGGNPGFGTAVNLGIRATSSDLIVLLNNDARAEPGFLRAITQPFRDGHARLAAVTARIQLTGHFTRVDPADAVYVDKAGRGWARLLEATADDAGIELLNSTGLELSESGNGSDRSWLAPVDAPPPPVEVFGFCGGGAAILRAALDEVGLFDERLFMYYEDTDLSWRLRRFGWSIRYADDARTVHHHAASSGTSSQLFLVNNIRNRLLVTAKNAPRIMLGLSIARTIVSLFRSLVYGIRSRHDGLVRPRAVATATALRQASVRFGAFIGAGRELDRKAIVDREFVRAWTVKD